MRMVSIMSENCMDGKTETVEESLHGIVLTQERIRSPGCF